MREFVGLIIPPVNQNHLSQNKNHLVDIRSMLYSD